MDSQTPCALTFFDQMLSKNCLSGRLRNAFQESNYGKTMFSHVMIGANDLEAFRTFYDAVLDTLKLSPGVANNDNRYFYRSPEGSFSITKPIDGQTATLANGGTIGFLPETPEQVQAFHAAGIANGGASCEEPRPQRRAIWCTIARVSSRSIRKQDLRAASTGARPLNEQPKGMCIFQTQFA